MHWWLTWLFRYVPVSCFAQPLFCRFFSKRVLQVPRRAKSTQWRRPELWFVMLVTVSRLFLSMFSFLWLKNDWTTKATFSRLFGVYNFLPGRQKSVFHAFHCFARCTNLLLLLCSSACSTMHVDSFCRHFSHHQQKMHLLQLCPWAARQLRWFYVGYAVCKGLIKVNPFWLVLWYVALYRLQGQNDVIAVIALGWMLVLV